MALYYYVKKKPQKRKNFWPVLFLLAGFIFLVNAALPIFLYWLKSPSFSQSVAITPVESFFPDYNSPQSWFPAAPKLAAAPTRITHYNLSIPRLKIDKAVVQIGGEDLSESLIHYPGTAFPGQYGNVVIFGHSVLPQFFNPKHYQTIFSTLPTLKPDDEILVDFDGIEYLYRVTQLQEVGPNDVSVLEQHYEAEYLSLVTCVPPGTYLKRLIVRAKLVNPFYQ